MSLATSVGTRQLRTTHHFCAPKLCEFETLQPIVIYRKLPFTLAPFQEAVPKHTHQARGNAATNNQPNHQPPTTPTTQPPAPNHQPPNTTNQTPAHHQPANKTETNTPIATCAPHSSPLSLNHSLTMVRYGADALGEPEACSSHHPKWRAPTAVPADQENVLRIHNTLTGRLDEFVPQKGRQVRWYNCGPTVYDESHLGHARTYLTFDIIRRIMEDYFNLDVVFQTNITDVDDKIIMRSRCNELVRRYKEANHPFEKVQADVQSAVDATHKALEDKVAKLTAEIAAFQANENAKPTARK
jgi:hypothetical protein